MKLQYLILIIFIGIFAGCTAKVTSQQEGAANVQASMYEKQCSDGQCPCPTPMGTIKHGTKLTVYDKSEVTCGLSCLPFAHEVTCDNGKLTPDLTVDQVFSCSVAACKSCTVENNLIRHGESAFLYAKASVSCSESCVDIKAERKCNNGVLEGDSQFQYGSCQSQLCHCALPEGNSYLTLGGKMTFYKTSQSQCGFKCSDYAKERTCVQDQNGGFSFSVLASGDELYTKGSCAEATGCECQLPAGNTPGTVKDGDVFYMTSKLEVPCENQCLPSYTIGVKCSNGKLLNTSDNNKVIDIATTLYKSKGSCTVTPCKGCFTNPPTNTVTVSHNSNKTWYLSQSPACSAPNCQGKIKTCKDGVFIPVDEYNAPTCAQRSCRCYIPDQGGYIGVNGSLPFYKIITTQGPSFRTPGCGKSCENVKELKTCTETEVVPNQSYSYGFSPTIATDQSSICNPTPGCDCVVPGSGEKVLDKVTITVYKQASVACGTTCSSTPNLKLVCDSGTWRNNATGDVVDTTAANFEYNKQCVEASCTECALAGFGGIANNSGLKLYPKAEAQCGEDPALLSAEFFCASGVLLKNGQTFVDDGQVTTWYSSIVNKCTGCKTPWNVTVPFGTSVNFFKQSGTVENPCGQGCKVATRKCRTDGTFDGIESEYADYKLQACVNSCAQEGGGAPPRLCLMPWQNSFVTPDGLIPMWSKRKVGCNDSCQNYFKLGRCMMETGSFDAGFDYIYQSCTEVCN